MQNKNNAITITLLVVLILLVGYMAFFKGEVRYEPVVPENKPQVYKPPAFVKDLVGHSFLVKECTYEDKKVFTTDMRPVDGGLSVYDSSGTELFYCDSGFGPKPSNPIKQCMPGSGALKDCKTIYSTLDGKKIDIYNLSN